MEELRGPGVADQLVGVPGAEKIVCCKQVMGFCNFIVTCKCTYINNEFI